MVCLYNYNLEKIDRSEVHIFSDPFDVKNFSKVSLDEGLPPLVPWDNFIANSRNVIVGDLHYYNQSSRKL